MTKWYSISVSSHLIYISLCIKASKCYVHNTIERKHMWIGQIENLRIVPLSVCEFELNQQYSTGFAFQFDLEWLEVELAGSQFKEIKYS